LKFWKKSVYHRFRRAFEHRLGEVKPREVGELSATMQSYADYAAQMRADAAHMSALVTCGCALPRRVPELFLCETCVALSCDQCSAVEIDACFCANCFATPTAAAAAQDGYRCKHCMECPSCTHVLSLVRDAASVCKFVCESCQWVSDSIGLVDAVPTGLLSAFVASAS
jgi:hypothetical protein